MIASQPAVDEYVTRPATVKEAPKWARIVP